MNSLSSKDCNFDRQTKLQRRTNKPLMIYSFFSVSPTTPLSPFTCPPALHFFSSPSLFYITLPLSLSPSLSLSPPSLSLSPSLSSLSLSLSLSLLYIPTMCKEALGSTQAHMTYYSNFTPKAGKTHIHTHIPSLSLPLYDLKSTILH